MRNSVHFAPPSAERLWRFTSGTQMALGLPGSNAGGCGVCARSSSTHSHVSPPSLERAIAPCSTPANSVLLFGCSMTYETTRSLSFLPDSFQLLPPSVDRHTPPPSAAQRAAAVAAGLRTRPTCVARVPLSRPAGERVALSLAKGRVRGTFLATGNGQRATHFALFVALFTSASLFGSLAYAWRYIL